MGDTKKPSCATCAHWDATDEERADPTLTQNEMCYGVPPRALADGGITHTLWPLTRPKDRCPLWREHDTRPRLDPERCSGCAAVASILARIEDTLNHEHSDIVDKAEVRGAARIVAYIQRCLAKGKGATWNGTHNAIFPPTKSTER